MRKIKRSSFVEGTFIAYLALIFSKLLGALYSIPFYAIIGERGGVIYACAYNIYCLFLAISVSGIPNAVSIIVSEYNSLRMYWAKERVRALATRAISIISISAFVLMFSFAGIIGRFFLGAESGADVTLAIRTISFSVLIVPYLSITRGYMQGHAFIAPSSASDVLEQVVRIIIILAGSYVTIKMLHLSEAIGVSVALSGATFGALAAFVFLKSRERANPDAFLPPAGSIANERRFSDRTLLKKIANICIPIVIVSIATDIYNITDMKLVMLGLQNLGFTRADSDLAASIIATWGPKVCMVINALAMGLSSSIVPHIVASYVKRDYKDVNAKFNQALSTVIVVALPMAVGMVMLSKPIYTIFYGESVYGPVLMTVLPIVSLASTLSMVASMAMQSIGRAKLVCVTTVVGVTVNASLDLPLMYLFNSIGLPPYLGAAVSSVIGQLVALGITMTILKRQLGFRYMPIVRVLVRTLAATLMLILIVFTIKFVFPLSGSGRLASVVYVMIAAVLGGGVYFALALLGGTLGDVLGRDTLNKIFKKLHIRVNI